MQNRVQHIYLPRSVSDFQVRPKVTIAVPDDSPEDASAYTESEVAGGPCRNQLPTVTDQ